MIIYNIRKNGPYEYDKFVLNIGQIYNLVYDVKTKYDSDEIHKTLESLNDIINKITNHDSYINKLELQTSVSMKEI